MVVSEGLGTGTECCKDTNVSVFNAQFSPMVGSKGQTGTGGKKHKTSESNRTELSASLLFRTSSSRARGVSNDAGDPCGHSVAHDRIWVLSHVVKPTYITSTVLFSNTLLSQCGPILMPFCSDLSKCVSVAC